ncbi:MAG: putative negative regulator of RcsB-dependent stress response, partial [Maribacter sp.]
QASEYHISESEINTLGYQLLAKNKLNDALKVFKLNTELYPNAFNTFDSYGECLMKLGKKDEAVKAYEKSLMLNSANENARKMIDELALEEK